MCNPSSDYVPSHAEDFGCVLFTGTNPNTLLIITQAVDDLIRAMQKQGKIRGPLPVVRRYQHVDSIIVRERS